MTAIADAPVQRRKVMNAIMTATSVFRYFVVLDIQYPNKLSCARLSTMLIVADNVSESCLGVGGIGVDLKSSPSGPLEHLIEA